MAKKPEKPSQPDLITRYNLKDKLDTLPPDLNQDQKGKGWSSNRDERQISLQRRREEMVLAARKKMEARLAGKSSSES